jgi:hypothetical protein
MATTELFVGMPQVELTGGAILKLEAIDPTTGAAVGGVVAKDMVIYGNQGAAADEGPDEPLKEIYVLPTSQTMKKQNP